ncbi:hypothetical protein ABFA07_008409 [Porites harrisoni]
MEKRSLLTSFALVTSCLLKFNGYNGYTPEDRLEGLNLQLGDWHTGVKILELLFRRFYSRSSSDDECSMYFDATIINRRNVREDPHTAYQPETS